MRTEKILAMFCIIVMILIGITGLFIPRQMDVFSEHENRMLQGKPSVDFENIIGGDFSVQFENFLIDNIFFRNTIIKIKDVITQTLSIATIEDTFLVVQDIEDINDFQEDIKIENDAQSTDAVDITATENISNTLTKESKNPTISTASSTSSAELKSTPVPTQTLPPRIDPNEKLYIYIKDDDKQTNIIYYKAGDILEVCNTMNAYAQYLPDDGNAYYIMTPTSKKMRPYSSIAGKSDSAELIDEPARLFNIYSSYNVEAVSAVEILQKPIKEKEKVYYYTDMHWTIKGSHYVYKEIMKLKGFIPLEWDEYKMTQEYPFLGTYYRNDPKKYYKENPDTLDIIEYDNAKTFERYIAKDETKLLSLINMYAPSDDRFTVYYGGARKCGPMAIINTSSDTGKNAFVIQDSFGLAMSQMLIPHYDKIFVADIRYHNDDIFPQSYSEFMTENQISDLFVIVGDLDAYGSDFSKKLLPYYLDN